MGQLLRITFGNKDHTFKLLGPLPSGEPVQEVPILLSGEPKILVREGNDWIFKDNTDIDLNHLADAIGKAISLRFRI